MDFVKNLRRTYDCNCSRNSPGAAGLGSSSLVSVFLTLLEFTESPCHIHAIRASRPCRCRKRLLSSPHTKSAYFLKCSCVTLHAPVAVGGAYSFQHVLRVASCAPHSPSRCRRRKLFVILFHDWTLSCISEELGTFVAPWLEGLSTSKGMVCLWPLRPPGLSQRTREERGASVSLDATRRAKARTECPPAEIGRSDMRSLHKSRRHLSGGSGPPGLPSCLC